MFKSSLFTTFLHEDQILKQFCQIVDTLPCKADAGDELMIICMIPIQCIKCASHNVVDLAEETQIFASFRKHFQKYLLIHRQ